MEAYLWNLSMATFLCVFKFKRQEQWFLDNLYENLRHTTTATNVRVNIDGLLKVIDKRVKHTCIQKIGFSGKTANMNKNNIWTILKEWHDSILIFRSRNNVRAFSSDSGWLQIEFLTILTIDTVWISIFFVSNHRHSLPLLQTFAIYCTFRKK